MPPLLAARLRGIPTLIHEQNAVMGRANRLLARARHRDRHRLPGVLDRDPALAAKATHTGNPVRPAVLAAAATPYAAPEPDGPLRLLVFGGSQGARVMADIVPPAIERLTPRLRRAAVASCSRRATRTWRAVARALCAARASTAEVAPFFTDLPARIAASHLVVVALRRLDGGRTGRDRPARRSWCRCRTRSIRTRSPMPACWQRARPVAQRDFTPTGWHEFTLARPRLRTAEIARASAGSTPPTGSPIWREVAGRDVLNG